MGKVQVIYDDLSSSQTALAPASDALEKIHTDLDSLARGFEAVGYKKEEIESRFQSMFTAFRYGCPPHGGMALGIDRIIMILKDEINLREVQAFPVSTSGMDYMMGSPSSLDKKQLDELGIIIREE